MQVGQENVGKTSLLRGLKDKKKVDSSPSVSWILHPLPPFRILVLVLAFFYIYYDFKIDVNGWY